MQTPTQEQAKMLAFARAHDWGYDASITTDGGVRVASLEPVGGTRENPVHERVPFTAYSLAQLREWAGY